MRHSVDVAVGGSESLIVAGVPQYLTALKAMRKHKSQLVWFRWLYVSFSRYMWVNEWMEVTACGSE